MPDFLIDDRACGHPKILGLSDGAFRLWVNDRADNLQVLCQPCNSSKGARV